MYEHVLGPLPSWHCPGWNQSFLYPVQQAAFRWARPDSVPGERGSWIWKASPAHQELPGGHEHPSKQQFPKKGDMRNRRLSDLTVHKSSNVAVYLQHVPLNHVIRVQWATYKTYLSDATHGDLSFNTSVRETSSDREYKRTIKARGEKALGKTSLSCLSF